MKRLGKYELHETVGAGAMSTVYRGVDPESGESLAVKVLHPHLSGTANQSRFEREAHALAALKHPNIVGFKEFFRGGEGEACTVLEFVQGVNLAEWAGREREVDPDLAAMMVLEIARAVSVAHAKEIIHRDLKPENILIHSDGFLKISDFGLAYLWEGTDLTLPGTRIGSPAYMSPEQIRGEKPAPRMDVYSLGILFYYLLTGELPFQGKSRRETFDQILTRIPPAPGQVAPHIPEELSRLCMKMLGKGEGERVGSADEVIRTLEAYLAGVGLANYEKIVRQYLIDPKGNRDQVRRELLAGYLKMGKKLVERGDRERVFRFFKRMIAVTGVSSASSATEEILPTRRVKLFSSTKWRVWLLLTILAAVLAGAAQWMLQN